MQYKHFYCTAQCSVQKVYGCTLEATKKWVHRCLTVNEPILYTIYVAQFAGNAA